MSGSKTARRIAAPIIAAAVLFFTPLGDGPLVALLPVGDVPPVDFATLAPPDKPNHFLACPADFCAAPAQAASPVFATDATTLRGHWDAVMADQPRLAVIGEQGGNIDYVQRSALVRFPDIITVRFMARPPNGSTLALYSRSVYGTSDFGVNEARVEAWLAALKRRVGE